ncbi:hypothetical protein GALL_295730 [mine drainage metagenome]|uniref:Uncharacterized protein n=1 Tax=mine drainage metagenome TaxID=410659 RepID=A0A1J5QXX0_9ZZZZ
MSIATTPHRHEVEKPRRRAAAPIELPTPDRRLDVSLSAGTGRSRIPDGISTADRYDGSVTSTGNSHPREAHSSLWVGVRPRPRRLREVFGQVLDQGLHAHRTPAPPEGVTMCSAMGLSFSLT